MPDIPQPSPTPVPENTNKQPTFEPAPTYGNIGIPTQEEVKEGIKIVGDYENDGNTWVLQKVDSEGNVIAESKQDSLELQESQKNENNESEDPNTEATEKKEVQPFEGATLKISEKMEGLSSTLSAVNNKFNNGRAIHTNYVLFTVNGAVLVDTASKNWNTNNLISFTHDMSGSGQANKFTLDIAFIPNDRSVNDILTIEKILLDATRIVDANGELKPSASEKGNYMLNCKFKYGYGDCDIRSSEYTGFILGYTPSLENGWLRYTITGIAGLYNCKEMKLTSKQEYLANGGDTNPLTFLDNIFKTEFETFKYKFKVMENVEPNVTCDTDYTNVEQKNLFDLLNDICNSLMSTKEQQALESGQKFVPPQKQVYSYYVSSNASDGSNGTVYLYKCPSVSKTSSDSDTALKADCEMSFNWFSPSETGANFLIKSWKPNIDGTIVMAQMLNYLTMGDEYQTMDQDGNILTVVGMGATRLGTNNSEQKNYTVNSMQEYSKWSYVTQYPYEATMVIQGLPCEVPMSGKISVNAYMGNFSEKHQSSGVYMVTGKKDIINSSGFTSEFKLFKIEPTWNPPLVSKKSFTVNGIGGTATYDEDGNLIGIEVDSNSNDGTEQPDVVKESEYVDNTQSPFEIWNVDENGQYKSIFTDAPHVTTVDKLNPDGTISHVGISSKNPNDMLIIPDNTYITQKEE